MIGGLAKQHQNVTVLRSSIWEREPGLHLKARSVTFLRMQWLSNHLKTDLFSVTTMYMHQYHGWKPFGNVYIFSGNLRRTRSTRGVSDSYHPIENLPEHSRILVTLSRHSKARSCWWANTVDFFSSTKGLLYNDHIPLFPCKVAVVDRFHCIRWVNQTSVNTPVAS